MIQLEIYGKGGIGKSTVACNLSAALAGKGLRVMQIGCDPKADSTMALTGGRCHRTVMELIREYGRDNISIEDMVSVGYKGVLCVECGGPTPGMGCAGRAISACFELLEQRGAFEELRADAVIYDVLGYVVCGGFSVPMREGYADKVYIVTSGNMALYAAGNIALAVENFRDRGYASLGGIILNRRGVKNEDEKVRNLALDSKTEIVGCIDRTDLIQDAEDLSKTVTEAFPESHAAAQYAALADAILRDFGIRGDGNA